GVEIYFGFLEAAGDYAARSPEHTHEALGFDMGAWYAERARAAEALFAEDLTAARVRTAYVGGPVASRVAAAQKMAALGAFYASTPSGYNTAAALLAAAYDIRSSILGSEHEDTLQTMLMLAPVYANLGQLGDAERLYLRVFHSQERRQGANNPDLSLYLKLLAQIYERQARLTEAEALYEHIRSLFSDAYGAQRYAASRTSDPLTAIDRPVSGAFPLAAEYRPPDLVSAAGFGVPLSKPEGIEEMMVRLAPDAGDAAGVRNLPARLASLMSLCERQSGERLTLRSGFRSFATQQQLYALNGAAGRTAPAGASEHQSGLAVDIDVNGRFMRRSDRAYQCFQQNAFQYGFLLSYPQGNSYLPAEQSFEPWHWRYVGVETARLYREAGPLNKPLEFLAALPCYRELAARELSANASGQDVCLTETDNTDS
ncbi:MAG: D-alanyl-D-alanine carboxypeptidase family protein, partial [Pseudomonadota bacterium]